MAQDDSWEGTGAVVGDPEEDKVIFCALDSFAYVRGEAPYRPFAVALDLFTFDSS